MNRPTTVKGLLSYLTKGVPICFDVTLKRKFPTLDDGRSAVCTTNTLQRLMGLGELSDGVGSLIWDDPPVSLLISVSVSVRLSLFVEHCS